jgi:peptidoglycan/xylan/chitin deacetylase (PgdA/CDA1 family)
MIKKSIFNVIRITHKIFMQKQLPQKVAIYFHNIESKNISKFEELLNYFKNKGYVFCDPNDYVAKNGNCIFISFDDNFSDWLSVSELLANRNIRATFYINTGPIRDVSTSSDIKEYFKRIRYNENAETLSSDQIIKIYSQYNHCIGSHTVNHFNLAALEIESSKEEIGKNKRDLEQLIGSPVRHFSYPFGMRQFFTEELRKYCSELGFETISNAIPGLLHNKVLNLDIPRTRWDFNKSLNYNLVNLKIDGSIFEKMTGKSPIG